MGVAIFRRVILHLGLCVAWTLDAMMVIPLSWLAMNSLFWQAGIGPVLVERPVAAVHHRMMGTMRAFDNQGDLMANLEGHLRDYPDASAEERQLWQARVDEVRSERRWLLARVFGVFAAAYIPAGIFIEMWRHWGTAYPAPADSFEPQ